MCKMLYENVENMDKDKFFKYRKTIKDKEDCDELIQAYMYFAINRCSFSGATMSGGFSEQSSKQRFTRSSIERIEKLKLEHFNINNKDFSDFLNSCCLKNRLIFLDPPYYLEEKSKLYGTNGDMHDKFDHKQLKDVMKDKTNWLMTYNNCKYVKELYSEYKIIETNWSYGMNKSKESSEIIIIG